MIELLLYLAKLLVNNPEEVQVKEVKGKRDITLELIVNSNDLGRIIGKEGRIIKAIRTIVNTAAIKQGKKVAVELVE
ncbi:KH domain-containing protein [bacterium]|nr:KH domain-containing protein [bacterium]